MEDFFVLHPRPPRKFQFSFLLCFYNFEFSDTLPLGISNDLLWSEYGFFLELHIILREECEVPVSFRIVLLSSFLSSYTLVPATSRNNFSLS